MSDGAGLNDGLRDMRDALARHWLWRALGRNDVRHRYSGSLIGSLWVGLNLALLVAALTFLFSAALGESWRTYAPYVAIGLVLWQFVHGTLNEAPQLFVTAAETIRNTPLPLSLFAMRLVWRNVVVLAYQMPVLAALLLAFGIGPSRWVLTLPLALLVLFAAGFSATLLLGVLGARFRDVQQLVTNLLQLLFFVTPIFWLPAALGAERAWLAFGNPIFAFIDIVRAPLLGGTPAATSWPIALAATVVLAIAVSVVLGRARGRIAFWI